jgi:hypothetical protein
VKRIILIAAAGLILAGCGTSHTPSAAPKFRHPPTHYPVVVRAPVVTATRHPGAHILSAPIAQIVSPRRLAISEAVYGQCWWAPATLTIVDRGTIRIRLSLGTDTNGLVVTHPVCREPWGYGRPTQPSSVAMLVPINPHEIDVHHPLSVRLVYAKGVKPDVITAPPLES